MPQIRIRTKIEYVVGKGYRAVVEYGIGDSLDNEATGEWGTEDAAEAKLDSLKETLTVQLKKLMPDLEITTREEDQ